MQLAAPVNPAQDVQRQPLEGMALTNDGYLLGISSEMVVGSVSSGPLTTCGTICCSVK